MKKILVLSIGACLLVSACSRPRKAEAGHLESATGNPFTTDLLLKTTPVKQQDRSPLCWAYAMLATIETNHLMQGDSVNLSIDYMARCLLTESVRRYYLSRGTSPINLRGMGTRLLALLETYGACPYDSYHAESANYNVIVRRLEQAARASRSLTALDQRANAILDAAIGYLPGKQVHMLGADYTPREFAHSVCRSGEYQAITSFTHHAFGTQFVLEVPDNLNADRVLNLPLDTLMQFIVGRLRSGRAVYWEGDITSPGFDFAAGTAEVGHPVTQQQRQQAFESLQTTDDHALELVGLAHDKQDRRYFIAKNAWGTANRFGGFLYLSEDYLRLNTVMVVG